MKPPKILTGCNLPLKSNPGAAPATGYIVDLTIIQFCELVGTWRIGYQYFGLLDMYIRQGLRLISLLRHREQPSKF